MNIIAYCYGPFSIKKNLFCENFTKANKDFKLIQPHLLREKITGSILPTSKASELKVVESVKAECLEILNSKKKQKNVLINGLFLNKENRISLSKLFFTEKQEKYQIKTAAIAFLERNITECFEDFKNIKKYKDITFDILKSQFLNFKTASTQEEADVLIYNIEEHSDGFNVNAKLWGEDISISCNTYKKVAEYIKHTSSF
jgi:hypothetical protein